MLCHFSRQFALLLLIEWLRIALETSYDRFIILIHIEKTDDEKCVFKMVRNDYHKLLVMWAAILIFIVPNNTIKKNDCHSIADGLNTWRHWRVLIYLYCVHLEKLWSRIFVEDAHHLASWWQSFQSLYPQFIHNSMIILNFSLMKAHLMKTSIQFKRINIASGDYSVNRNSCYSTLNIWVVQESMGWLNRRSLWNIERSIQWQRFLIL